MAPAEESPLLPAFVFSRAAPVRSRLTTATIDNYFGLETLKMVVPLSRSKSNRALEGKYRRRRARVSGGGVHRPGWRYPPRPELAPCCRQSPMRTALL